MQSCCTIYILYEPVVFNLGVATSDGSWTILGKVARRYFLYKAVLHLFSLRLRWGLLVYSGLLNGSWYRKGWKPLVWTTILSLKKRYTTIVATMQILIKTCLDIEAIYIDTPTLKTTLTYSQKNIKPRQGNSLTAKSKAWEEFLPTARCQQEFAHERSLSRTGKLFLHELEKDSVLCCVGTRFHPRVARYFP